MNLSKVDDLKHLIRQLPDYPVKGVIFLDITPLFKDKNAFSYIIRRQAEYYKGKNIDVVAGVEARGFIVGSPLAYELGVGFVPIRKPGKLPWKKKRVEYELEYGKEAVEVHEDAFYKGESVLLVDDLLATGGTAKAAATLIESLNARVTGISFVVELVHLGGRKKLNGFDVHSLIKYNKQGNSLV
ncbi:MAG: adenine phosphoribosyltransferase [Nitrososphaerota archaeon]